MKKILVSLSIITAVLSAAVIGATASFFNDTETSAGNVLGSGTLDLKVDNQDDPYVYYFDVRDLKPTDGGEHTFNLKNTGSITGALSMEIKNYINDGNGLLEPEIEAGDASDGIGEGELDQQTMVKIWLDDDCQNDYDANDEMIFEDYADNIPTDVDLLETKNISLAENEIQCIALAYEFKEGLDNNLAQGDSFGFNILFGLEQSAEEGNDNGEETECTANEDCNDANPCTNDICESGECVYSSISGISCDDGNPCTINDTCSDGECIGTPKSCDDGNFCTTDTCNETTGECEYQCNINTPCDDGNSDTIEDKCQSVDGECQCVGESTEGKVLISVVPSVSQVNAGESFTADIKVNPNGYDISGIQFDFEFNPSLVQADEPYPNHLTWGVPPVANFLSDPGIVNNTQGQIIKAFAVPSNFDAGLENYTFGLTPFTLATINLTANSSVSGISYLRLPNTDYTDTANPLIIVKSVSSTTTFALPYIVTDSSIVVQ